MDKNNSSPWDSLAELGHGLTRQGFGVSVLLGNTSHEVRSLASCHMPDGSLLVVAGDKLGRWYSGTFDPQSGAPGDVRWRELPPLGRKDRLCVVDLLRIVSWRGELAVAIGTRGDGAWLIPVAAVATPGWLGEGLLALPGSRKKVVRQLIADPHAGTLWAALEDGRLSWSLLSWRLLGELEVELDEQVNVQITALAIDQDDDGGGQDHLYIASNPSGLHRACRIDGSFRVSSAALTPERALWRGRGSVIERMVPISDIREQIPGSTLWRRKYRERGLVGATLRHLLLLHDGPAPDSAAFSQTRLVTARSRILDLAVLCFPSWHGLAVSTLDGKVRIFRPSGIRRPDGDAFAPYAADTPEGSSPLALFSGFEDVSCISDRVYGFSLPERHVDAGSSLQVILGLGNNTVQLMPYTLRWELRRKANDAAQAVLRSLPLDKCLAICQERALHSGEDQQNKEPLILLLPQLGRACKTPEQWRVFRLIIWDTLAHSANDAVPIDTLQALRDLQVERRDEFQSLDETICRIRKYLLDRTSFSGKQTGFAQLMDSTDPGLTDERIVFRSILCSRRHGLIFRRGFQPIQFGEVQAFARIPPVAPAPTASASGPIDDEERPEDLRFLVATYRRLFWLCDGTGQAIQLTGADPAWGHVQAVHLRATDLVLSFSVGGLFRILRHPLRAPFKDGEVPRQLRFYPLLQKGPFLARALCALPGAEAADPRFLWGDASGCIHLMTPKGSRLLADLKPSLERWGKPESAIADLQPYTERAADGTWRLFVGAITGFGSLHVLEWFASPHPRLSILDTVRTGSAPATSLLVANSSPRQIVVASLDGLVAGYWLIPTPDGSRHLALYWAYRAGDAVRTIQHLHPYSPSQLQVPKEPLIVVGSYDEHLHILDMLGRQLEVVYLPGIRVDRFVTTRKRSEDGAFVEARIYACGFENLFCGIFLMSRRRLIEDIEKNLRLRDPGEREEALSRWRSYPLREGHLRHRFVRQSQRYPGTGTAPVVAEIRRLLKAGDSSQLPTGLVTALLRRLFQNRTPGDAVSSSASPCGLREIFDSAELYRETVRLLSELEEQWDTPASVASRRVSLFWIRSFLRGLEDLFMLRRWLELGSAMSTELPLAAPARLIEHYLEHPHELIQLKTLQYLERQFFGWRGVAGNPLFVEGAMVSLSDFDWLLTVLLQCVRARVGPLSRDEPSSVLLQIGRILALLVQAGHLEPLYLLSRLQDERALDLMSPVLEDQCRAMASMCFETNCEIAGAERRRKEADRRLLRAAEIIRRGRTLETLLLQAGSIDQIVQGMQALVEESASTELSDSAPRYLHDLRTYYRTLIPLLCVTNLEDIVALQKTWVAAPDGIEAFPSRELLAQLPDLLARTGHYWDQKYKDLYLYPPMCALQHNDFYDMLLSWRHFERRLAEQRETYSQQERLLLDRLVHRWRRIVDDEQTKNLLRDLFEVVDMQLTGRPEVPLNAVEAMTRVKEEEHLTFSAFSNLFTRLLLFAEPQRASFYYLQQGDERRVGQWSFYMTGEVATITNSKAITPFWLTPERVERLHRDEILSWLAENEPGYEWRVEQIPSTTETALLFGFYLFGWETGGPGSERFDLHRLTWSPLLQALALRQASFEQQTMKNRLFSMVAHNLGSPVFKMRSDLDVLAKGFFDHQPEQREEKYRQLLRQARNMTGIIDGILSLSQRKMTVDITPVSLDQLLHEVVRTVRRDGKGKRVTIESPKPSTGEGQSICRTDEVKVYDILLNLLVNAVKYSPPGSLILTDLHLVRKGFEIRVRDEGPGIPKDELSMLFQPFFRGRLAERVPGLGLGLYISRLYAQKLGGRLQVANNPDGRGVTFSLFIRDYENGGVQEMEG